NDTPLDTMNPRVIKRLEEDLSQTIARRIRQAVKQAQKMNADIFNFAGAFHKDYPAEWKKASANWDDIFPNVDVKIMVDAKIKRPGLTTFPTETPKDEVEND
ncbi:MAG: Ger(x)C family spore germination C-terminal domain-containing protein, partial [Tuberibacillus sp.]